MRTSKAIGLSETFRAELYLDITSTRPKVARTKKSALYFSRTKCTALDHAIDRLVTLLLRGRYRNRGPNDIRRPGASNKVRQAPRKPARFRGDKVTGEDGEKGYKRIGPLKKNRHLSAHAPRILQLLPNRPNGYRSKIND